MSNRRRTSALFAAFVVLLTAVVISTLVLMAASMVRLLELNEKADSQRDLIVDCTVSTGECYKRQTARTGQVVGSINQVSTAAAACGAAHPGDIPATRACVETALKAGK